jgi:flagellar protein FliJ
MKRFAFTLETLLRHRRNLEEKQRIELYRLYSQRQSQLDRRKELLDRQEDALTELAEKRMAVTTDHEEMHWFYPYLDRLQSEISVCAKRIVQLEEAIEAQRTVVVQASKDKKVLDKLKSRQEKEFNSELEKREQKTIDELVTVQFAHKEPGNF